MRHRMQNLQLLTLMRFSFRDVSATTSNYTAFFYSPCTVYLIFFVSELFLGSDGFHSKLAYAVNSPANVIFERFWNLVFQAVSVVDTFWCVVTVDFHSLRSLCLLTLFSGLNIIEENWWDRFFSAGVVTETVRCGQLSIRCSLTCFTINFCNHFLQSCDAKTAPCQM